MEIVLDKKDMEDLYAVLCDHFPLGNLPKSENNYMKLWNHLTESTQAECYSWGFFDTCVREKLIEDIAINLFLFNTVDDYYSTDMCLLKEQLGILKLIDLFHKAKKPLD